MTDRLRASLEQWPKTELHLHLDGSLLVETALELARSRGVDAPRGITEMRSALVAPERCGSQAELLRAFDLPIALLQDAEALERVTRELVEVKAIDGVRYLEIRWGPLLHTARGLALDAGIAAVCAGAEAGAKAAAAAGRPIEVRLIATALRSHDPAANVALAEAAARGGGLRITLHAGEWGGAPHVRRALALEPERIAHGSPAIDDDELCQALIDGEIALDLCPTS